MKSHFIAAMLLVLMLNLYIASCQDIDRTFNLFKKKKEKIKEGKEKLKKPKYKPDQRTFFKHKNKKKKEKPSYKPAYHPAPAYSPPDYNFHHIPGTMKHEI